MTIINTKWKKILIIIFIALFTVIIRFLKERNLLFKDFILMNWLFENSYKEANIITQKLVKSPKEKTTKIKVKIDGAVKNPGVYEVESNTYLIELVEIAGIKSYADLNGLEKIKVEDGGEYYIPVRKLKEGEKININKIDEEEFLRIPFITKKLAKNIIEYRQKYGRFDSIEEIMEVDGIGPATFNKIKNFITIGD